MKYINYPLTWILISFCTLNSFSQQEDANPQTITPDSSYIFMDFYGSGDIQNSLSDSKPFNANTSLGVYFERHNFVFKLIESFELEANLNIASTSDSIFATFDKNETFNNQRDFGSYVLNPQSRKQSIYINANLYLGKSKITSERKKIKRSLIGSTLTGVNFRTISSNNIWTYKTDHVNLGAFYFRAGVFHEFIPYNYRKSNEDQKYRKQYSISAGVNYSWRTVFGDLRNSELLNTIMGLNKYSTVNRGFELNFIIKLKNLSAEFQLPILQNRERVSINGLTDTQAIFSVRFTGGFSVLLSQDNNQNADVSQKPDEPPTKINPDQN